MRMIWFFTALLLAGAAQAAENISIASEIYVEHAQGQGKAAIRTIGPAATFARGDRIVTILRWNRPSQAAMHATSRIPAGLSLQGISRNDVQISTDGGQRWRTIARGMSLPVGVTHIRWNLGRSEGQLTYRAIVR